MPVSRAHALRRYVLRRLLLIVPTLLGITFVVFLLCQFVPGGPIDQMRMRIAGADQAGEAGAADGGRLSSIEIPEADLESLQRYYGFDRPVLVRYGLYLANLATLDLGDSFRYTMPVEDLIVSRLPVSVYFGGIAFLLTYSICIPLGILKALRHKSQFDNLTSLPPSTRPRGAPSIPGAPSPSTPAGDRSRSWRPSAMAATGPPASARTRSEAGRRRPYIQPSQSSRRKLTRPMSRDRRAMTVYPKEAPKEIIRNQMPTLEAWPTAPVCSTEKKK